MILKIKEYIILFEFENRFFQQVGSILLRLDIKGIGIKLGLRCHS